jgi:transmembrane sensor
MENMKLPKFSKTLITRSFSSELSENEQKKLIAWLESDAGNLAEYMRLKKIWESSAHVFAQNQDEFEKSWQRFLKTIRTNKGTVRTGRLLFFRIAASVALVAGLTSMLVWIIPKNKDEKVQISETDSGNSYIITPGGQKVILSKDQTEIRYDSLAAGHQGFKSANGPIQGDPPMLELVVPRSRRITLVLSDGSTVWLNSESRLRYPEYFSGSTRTVGLEGEAYFDVKKSEGKSFIVTTREISIKVLGTTFNVSAYADEGQISTTLVQGSIEMRENGSDNVRLLEPSQRAIYNIENNTIQVDTTDTELYTSWIHGYLKFSSESLEQVIQKLVRSYGISMEIADPVLKEYKFSGKLGLQETVNQVLNVIQKAAPIDYHEVNGTIIILNKNE